MKITFITFHNWDTKRIGGFHKFAEACALAGHETVFFSFERPYYILLKKEERLNAQVLHTLCKGTTYIVEKEGKKGEILNCTWPTLRLPMPIHRYVPHYINKWFESHSLKPFKYFQKKFLKNTDIFVFESCGLHILPIIKKFNPFSKIVYRPSDPLMTTAATPEIVKEETDMLLTADLTCIVNNEGLNLYRNRINDFDRLVKWKLLSNGVDIEEFKLTYPKPKILNKKNTALYVGARDIEWSLILEAAEKLPYINFIIVCPEIPPKSFKDANLKNLTYIPGIKPREVPEWITNCDIIIIPNPKGRFKIKPWGVTAKYYQAMAAKKPIVVFEDNDSLRNYSITVTHTYEEFIDAVYECMKLKREPKYSLEHKDWKDITNTFLEWLNNL